MFPDDAAAGVLEETAADGADDAALCKDPLTVAPDVFAGSTDPLAVLVVFSKSKMFSWDLALPENGGDAWTVMFDLGLSVRSGID